MPIQIVVLYILVISSFVVDQLSALYDAHWQIAEFSYKDPWHVGITIFWAAVIIWIINDIRNKRPSTPNLFLCMGIVCALFLATEAFDNEGASSVVVLSFQTVEVIIWLICYMFCLSNSSLKEWFKPKAT